ncbi:MFS transporter [Moheibacter stercoris]|uniref:DHA1 family arabinose polymer transporter-like MFS transporter n=1 Tax=Moheibacter stercoris TaxID=1628251 RepID=A0ABV2LR24_9FLAO
MKKGLIALAFGGMAIGMTEFTMMGILPDIAKDLNVSIPKAAHLIALYALGVVVGAPTLVLASSKYPPKTVLMAFMIMFVVFNGIFSIAPTMWSLELSRFASGLPHGAFFGVGSVVATNLATKGKEAQAIAIMFTGMTLANLIGVPIGTYVGHHFSWRLTYGIISLLGLITFFALMFWLPKIQTSSNQNLFAQLNYFKTWRAWLLIAIISIGTGGLFAWISYIAPLATEVSGVPENRVPLIMILVGLGMFFGNLLGGKLADTINPTKATMLCFSSMALCLIFVHFTSHIHEMAYVMAFITGMISFTVGSPLQMMLINSAKRAETMAASAGQASFNLGNTLGAYFGGIPITYGLAYNTPVLVGAGMALLGVMLTFAYLRSQRFKA